MLFPAGPSFVFVRDDGDMEYGALPDPLEVSSTSSFSGLFKSSPSKREAPLDTPYHLHRSSPTSVVYYQEVRTVLATSEATKSYRYFGDSLRSSLKPF